MPTAPKAASSNAAGASTGGTSPKASASTATIPRSANGTASVNAGAQHALEYFTQLEQSVLQLERELKAYTDPNVVGRDTVLLRSFFDQIVGRTMRIAQACKIPWTPPQNVARR